MQRKSSREYRTNHAAHKAARSLGWLSIGLGVAELLMPRALASTVGLPGRAGLLRLYGLREIATGVGLLMTDKPAPWIYARIGGDALDLATLGVAAQRGNEPVNTAIALGGVAAIAAADLACARGLGKEKQLVTVYDYSDRSGFSEPAEKMRGRAAAGDGSINDAPQVSGMQAADRETAKRP
ncbi:MULTISPECIES: transcriptional regulator [Pseudomonas]|uniref:transcriptional regulator n=1 Tax=Pseudomonas TaxID=286 RepID=UPI0012398731|nr:MULTISPECIES: transcriptional regulator [Pseudomonas]QIB50290.1 transcriptional regulator [Pseudomonas sp. OIL-1]